MGDWFKILELFIAVLTSVLASSGIWAFIQKRSDSKDIKAQMLIGLGHDRIHQLGLFYIERGWISSDEYENLYDYLYTPYKKLGGNGSAERVMKEVEKLEIRPSGLPVPGSNPDSTLPGAVYTRVR